MSSLFVSPRLFSMRALLPASMPKPYPAILKSSQASLTSQQPQALRLYVSHPSIHGATIIYHSVCTPMSVYVPVEHWRRHRRRHSCRCRIGRRVARRVYMSSGGRPFVRCAARRGYAHPPFLRFRERRWAGVRRRRCRGMRGYIRKDELYHY
ncbi:hypothetical protein B0H11DRAFT_2120798 [Mycena galericulata]|nr:hypothetical protein B0H11DRAFT_2120798 [Mycena galericulata]